MKKLIITSTLALVSLLCSAQGNTAMTFTCLVQDPALQGMAGAGFVSDCGTASTAAGLSAVSALSDSKGGVLASYQSNSGTGYISVAGGARLLPWMNLYVAGTYGICKSFETTDSYGFPSGTFTPNQIIGAAGLSFRILDWLSAGFNARIASETEYTNVGYKSFAGDIYVAGKFGGFRAAIGAMNLGPGVTTKSNTVFPLPSSIKLGLGYGAGFGESSLEVNADANCWFNSGFSAAAGIAYCFKGFVTLRGGYHLDGKAILPSYATLGLGLSFKGASLDLAYLFGGDALKNSFCAGLRYSF